MLVIWALSDLLVACAIRLAAEWERGVVFRLGKLSSVKGHRAFDDMAAATTARGVIVF